ncbi:MAG TPA: type VI secretion system tip protein TssI/VgrG [Stellaceae bacterium]|nr:type VI secretion system tip protein TssI/VgrG [Stellaceae bacterium]
MSVLGYTQTGYVFTVATPLGADMLLLQSFEGEEQISGLFEFRLDMESEHDDLDFTQVVGQGVTVTGIDKDGNKRYFNGIVARMAQSGLGYHFDVRPKLWELTLASDNRIFQNKSVPDIVKQVLHEQGVTDVKDSLTGTYGPRDYCVQYRETCFDFISRLMEEEGIFYFFQHDDGKHTMVLADDASAFQPCANLASVAFKPDSARAWEEQDLVTALSLEANVVTGKYQAEDFNFEMPTTQLLSTTTGSGSTMQIYEYPGLYQTKDDGDAYGKKRLDGLEAPARLVSGESTCRSFSAGCAFTLTGHPRSDANDTYVLSRIAHSGGRRRYRNSFLAFPSSASFRPPRLTPKPRIYGTQTAIVTGKAGEEIWTDKYGRIKVQFHWDQLGRNDENSSCWIRVAQSWAGKNWGAIYLPRIGQEVVVSFLEGDPDRPLITGSVYNGQQPVPYTLPDEQTKSTLKSNSSKGGNGFNEIRLEDKAGSEELYVHAQKDMKIDVLNDQTTTIANNRTVTIQQKDDSLTVSQGNRAVTVSQGNETLTVSQGNRAIAVSQGKETHSVQSTREVTVTGNETHTNNADFTQNVSGNYTLKVTGTLTIQATGDLTLKTDGALTVQSGTSMTVKSGTDLTGSAGTGLSLSGGTTMEIKGSASGTVDGGGMLTVKGGVVQIN